MILKGGPRAKAAELATHLLRTDTNETVRLLGTNGTAASDVRGSLLEMEAVAAGGRTGKPLYHVSISPEADERLTDEQWNQTAERLEKALGMADHQRIMVLHTKNGRQHAHIVWNRVDIETLKTAHHSHNYRTHEQVARTLEREFGLKRTQGRHAEVEGPRPEKKRPNTRESQQAARTGWSADQAKADILAAWVQSDSGTAFRAHLLADGYQLARGDRRDAVVLDPGGGVHSVARRAKVKVAEVRARLADVDLDQLPSVEQAKALVAAAKAARPVAARAGGQQPEPARYEALKPPPTPPSLARRSQTYYPAPSQPRLATTPPQQPRPPVPAQDRPAAPIPPPPARPPQPRLEPKPQMLAPPPLRSEPKPAPPQPIEPDRPANRPPYLAVQPRRPVAPVQREPAPPVAAPTPPAPRVSPTPLPSQAVEALGVRQAGIWQQTASRIDTAYRAKRAALETHHERRLGEITAAIDQRLTVLNGLASRAGALANRQDWLREIAYLTATRQRKLAEEKARQERVKAELATAQAQELAAAKAKHDNLSALQQKALAEKESRPKAPSRTPGRHRDDYER